jgi:carbon-monoxide dehydrogenase medium subunit
MADPLALYHPTTLEETVALLDALDDAKIVAGSTALTIMLRQRLIAPSALIDINRLPGLDRIEVTPDAITLGSLVRHRTVERDPRIRERLPVLARAFGVVANVRVRNAATVGGVLAESDYASDPPAVFVALDAEIEVFVPDGSRTIPASEFFVAFYETAIEHNEVVTGVRVPIPRAGTGAVYEKFVTRSSEDRPCVGVAAVVRLGDDDSVEDLRVSVGAAAEIPQRFPDVEGAAAGRRFDDRLVREVADGYADRIDTLDDMRGSSWYRTEMTKVWVRRALESAAAESRRGDAAAR